MAKHGTAGNLPPTGRVCERRRQQEIRLVTEGAATYIGAENCCSKDPSVAALWLRSPSHTLVFE